MANLVKKAVLGTVLGASVLVAVAPTAEAQRYRRYRHHDDTGTAIVAGIAGLAIVDGYYYRDYYRRHRGWDRCYTRRVWDPYLDRPVRVRYCR